VFLYVLYVVMMSINKYYIRSMTFLNERFCPYACYNPEDLKASKIRHKPIHLIIDEGNDDQKIELEDLLKESDDSDEFLSDPTILDNDGSGGEAIQMVSIEDIDLDEIRHNPVENAPPQPKPASQPSNKAMKVLGWIVKIVMFPYNFIFHWTIPPLQGRFKYQYTASFTMTIVWIGLLSMVMIKMVEKIGCILHIDDGIMGVSLLAIGASFPDCIAAVCVARMGEGEMAVCSALGTNIFDQLVGLYLPWMVSVLFLRTPISVSSDSLIRDIAFATVMLLIVWVTFIVRRWRLDNRTGFFLYFLYFVFLCTVLLQLLGVF